MFSSGPNYSKLKTNLRLAINRLKLLQKKKAELTQKSRKEIADYISNNKCERARIRVEHIIREDYLVEAMEFVEMYCDLLLARFGLISQTQNLDEGLSEAISSVLWVAPRLQADVPEMKMISDLLTAKYGKPYAEACRKGSVPTIPERIVHKMSIQSPPALLVEKYLIEIAKNYNIEFKPDPQVMKEDQQTSGVDALLDLNDSDTNNLGGGQGPPQPAGFVGFPQPPMLPSQQPSDFQNFNFHGSANSSGNVVGFVTPPPLPQQGPSAPFTQGHGVSLSYNIPPGSESTAASPGQVKHLNTNILQDDSLPPPYSSFSPNLNMPNKKTKPSPRPKISSGENEAPSYMDLPELPAVPDDSLHPPGSVHTDDADEIDFDDLTRRFEDLKKKK